MSLGVTSGGCGYEAAWGSRPVGRSGRVNAEVWEGQCVCARVHAWETREDTRIQEQLLTDVQLLQTRAQSCYWLELPVWILPLLGYQVLQLPTRGSRNALWLLHRRRSTGHWEMPRLDRDGTN